MLRTKHSTVLISHKCRNDSCDKAVTLHAQLLKQRRCLLTQWSHSPSIFLPDWRNWLLEPDPNNGEGKIRSSAVRRRCLLLAKTRILIWVQVSESASSHSNIVLLRKGSTILCELAEQQNMLRRNVPGCPCLLYLASIPKASMAAFGAKYAQTGGLR